MRPGKRSVPCSVSDLTRFTALGAALISAGCASQFKITCDGFETSIHTVDVNGKQASYAILHDVAYVPHATPEQMGDLYLPIDGHAPHPVVVLAHGGAWAFGSLNNWGITAAAQFLAANGFVVFNVNYRLMGHNGEYPNDLQDVKDAIAFIAVNAPQWNIDLTRFALVGESSGAHLMLLAAYAPAAPPFIAPHYPGVNPRIRCIVSFYGPTDLKKYAKSPIATGLMHDYMRLPHSQPNSPLFAQGSPISYAGTGIPTLLVHGDVDMLVPMNQSLELERLLKKNGVYVKFVEVPLATHAFLDLPGPGRDIGFSEMLSFLNQQLAAAEAASNPSAHESGG